MGCHLKLQFFTSCVLHLYTIACVQQHLQRCNCTGWYQIAAEVN